MLSRAQLKRLRDEATDAEPNRLRRAIDIADTTQEALEETLGIPQSTISKVVNGQMPRLPLALAQTLAAHFGCSTDDLFPREEVSA